MMKKYHKIVTVYERDPDTRFKYLIDGQFAKPEFEYLARNTWIGTEKVDGTNIRVMWDGERIRYGGKTDNAQIPAFLVNAMDEMFPVDVFSDLYPDTPMCLYGEGFGAKIQKKGKEYLADTQSFILFDVRIGDVWLRRRDVSDIAHQLGILIVPRLHTGSLIEAIELARDGFRSQLSGTLAEGLVLRPETELLDRLGHRIITKIKYKDFPR
jgi:hypothetical protein